MEEDIRCINNIIVIWVLDRTGVVGWRRRIGFKLSDVMSGKYLEGSIQDPFRH